MKTKRITAALLVLALALSLAGCGGFAGRMTRAVKKMEKIRDYRMDLSLEAEIKLTALGQEMPMDLTLSGTSDVNTEPARTKTDLRVSVLGEESEMLSYTEKAGDSYQVYLTGDGGEYWVRQSLDVNTPDASTGAKTNLAGLAVLASKFEKTGVETVRGSEATVYAGTLTGEDLDSAVNLTERLKGALASMEFTADDLDIKNCGSIPVTVAIDNKSGLVTRYTVDLSEFMDSLMPKLMDIAMAEAAEAAGLEGMDLSMLGFSMDIGRVMLSAELYDFGAVGTIEIPPEALSAPEGTALTGLI